MNALDTNVLIRLLVADDDVQAARVKKLLERAERSGESFLISIPVLLETIWVLESSYDCPRATVLDALEQLTLAPVFRFEAQDRVARMIRVGRSEALGLADILIGLTAVDLGCEATLTFDKRASQSNMFRRIG